jgi:hypothetical protein
LQRTNLFFSISDRYMAFIQRFKVRTAGYL